MHSETKQVLFSLNQIHTFFFKVNNLLSTSISRFNLHDSFKKKIYQINSETRSKAVSLTQKTKIKSRACDEGVLTSSAVISAIFFKK